MSVTFFVPGCFPSTAGAIVYDTHLAAHLRALGHEVTVVIIDGFCLYAFAPLAASLRDAGAIALVHHPMSLEPQLPPPERDAFALIERQLLPCLPRIVVPSESTRASMISTLSLSPEALTVVTPGIPDAGRSVGSGGPTCRLLAVGSLIPRKGHDTVLRALAGLPDLDWHLTVCGDDTLDPAHAAELRALVDTLGLVDRVTWPGACAPEAMETLWRTADIFISGSRFEGYGMAVAEAIRRGLPLALTHGAAAPEIIPMDGCVIVEPGDHVQLSKALRRLVFSATLRRELAEASWQAGRALPTWDDQARRFAALLTG